MRPSLPTLRIPVLPGTLSGALSKALLVALLAALPAAKLAAQLRDDGLPGPPPREAQPGGAAWRGPASPLYDNGPLVNSPGTGVGGADESRLQFIAFEMTTLGFGNQLSQEARLADQFTVPEGRFWQVDRITFFGYQVGSTTASTFIAVNYRVLDGPPGEPTTGVVFGDTTTNRLLSSGWTGIYRVREHESGQVTDRPVMALVASGGFSLLPGTYWLDWQADATLLNGPWNPPVTINGQAETGDAVQSNDNGVHYEEIVDGGSEAPQGLPFVIEGSATGLAAPEVPALGPWGWLVLAAALAGAALTRLRR